MERLTKRLGWPPVSNVWRGLAAALVVAGGSSALAQEANRQVQLEAIDGSVKLQGEVVEFADGFYTLQTEIGLITIDAEAVNCSGPGCPAAQEAASAEPASRTIRLISDDGATEVVGELLAFNDDFYVIDTTLGLFRIDANGVTCVGEVCPQIDVAFDPEVTIAGGGYATGGLLPALLARFAESRGWLYDEATDEAGQKALRLLDGEDGAIVASITVNTETSSGAFAALASRRADVALVDQPLPPAVWRGVAEEYHIAHDALVVMTHENNPVRDLTLADLGRVWSGQITSWEPLGGGNFPLSVHMNREEFDQIPAVFTRQVLSPAGLSPEDLPSVTFHASPGAVAAAVKQDRNGIGLVGRVAAAEVAGRTLDLRKSCGLVSGPTDFELEVENYPLARPVLGYVASADPHPVAKAFLEWTRTNDAKLAVKDAGFGGDTLQRMKMRDMGVGIIQTSVMEEFDGAQFSSMLRQLRDADRLSITFRFQLSSSDLDAASVGFIKDLAARLRANEFEGLEVLLVGFADSTGGAALNTELARQRAEAVRAILLEEFDAATARDLRLQALSFGEQMPLDCNTTDAGRANNRRVEVWVRRPS